MGDIGGNCPQLESIQSRLLVVGDFKQLVEPGDDKNFENLWPERTELQFAARTFHLLIENNQLVKCRTGKKFNVLKVKQQFLLVFLLDKTEKLCPQFLDIRSVQDLAISKPNHGDVSCFGDFKMTCHELRLPQGVDGLVKVAWIG